MTSKVDCASCGHAIDASAKLCPYCGADPQTGRKFDTTPIIQSHFPPKVEVPKRAQFLEFVKLRQSLVLTALVLVVALMAMVLHQVISRRDAAEADAPAMPLTELADLSNRSEGSAVLPLPEMEFETEGDVRTVRTLLMEPGAVAPAASPAPSPSPAGPVPGSPATAPRRPSPPPAAMPR
jgi:RNA polymerase subunit RPABC4/transcription elongation factor Spt4